MTIKVPQNEEISGGKDGGRKGVGNLSLAAGHNSNLQGLSGPYKFTINSAVVKTCEFMKLQSE